ncbi:MAG: KH domain-containing protein [Candidatus Micrarchaeota archaeon]
MSEFVRIPAERVKVLRGRDGAAKRKLEKRCNVELVIDSEGEIEILGDPADIFFARDVVKAVGRGFTPEYALKLLDHDFGLYIIPLKEMISSENALVRIKGRIIGEKGRVKSAIEEATDAYISVYGNTVAIIARIDGMEYAKEAVGMLIDGARHTSVLSYLARAKRELIESRLKGR